MHVLHHYKLTRFSNIPKEVDDEMEVLHHYKLTRFSNRCLGPTTLLKFCTITNLQGSQTLGYEVSYKKCVLHHYKLTRFSNIGSCFRLAVSFCTITNLQGSQTRRRRYTARPWFCTITNLQGSQTSNEIITEPNISVNMRKPPSIV